MLVLRRKVGETIILDGIISISVLAVEGDRVKIGIVAPRDVNIVREELLKDAINRVPTMTSKVLQRGGEIVPIPGA